MARPLLWRVVFAAILFGLMDLFGFSWTLIGQSSVAFVIAELTEWSGSSRKT